MNLKDVRSQIEELRRCSKKAAVEANGREDDMDEAKKRLRRLIDKASEVNSDALTGIVQSMGIMLHEEKVEEKVDG